MLASLMRLFGLATLLLAALARAQAVAGGPILVHNDVNAPDSCYVTVVGSTCGKTQLQGKGSVTKVLCDPASAYMSCVTQGHDGNHGTTVGVKNYNCDTSLSGTGSTYSVQGSAAEDNSNGNCLLVSK